MVLVQRSGTKDLPQNPATLKSQFSWKTMCDGSKNITNNVLVWPGLLDSIVDHVHGLPSEDICRIKLVRASVFLPACVREIWSGSVPELELRIRAMNPVVLSTAEVCSTAGAGQHV